MSHQQLFQDDIPVPRRMLTAEGRLPELAPGQWCLFEREIYFRVDKDRLPQDYKLSHAGLRAGITLYEVRHVVIRDLIVQGFGLDGVNAHDSVFDAALTSLVCRGNGRSGVCVGGASRVRLEDCLIGDNGAAQLRTEGFSKTWLVNCDVIDNTAPAIVRDGGQVFMECPTKDQMKE